MPAASLKVTSLIIMCSNCATEVGEANECDWPEGIGPEADAKVTLVCEDCGTKNTVSRKALDRALTPSKLPKAWRK